MNPDEEPKTTLTPKGLAEALTTALEAAPADIPPWANDPAFPFELLSPVARGGQGQVWQARHREDQKLVALKIHYLDSPTPEIELECFRREVRALESIDHPHVIPVIAHGEIPEAQISWLAMPWINGGSLADLARSTTAPVPWNTLRPLALQACEALDHLHRNDLIHQDLKPSNLLVNEDHSHLWLTDLGMVSDGEDGPTTRPHLTPYTPGYCAPEILEGRTAPNPKSDQFSLAATLWYLLTGRLPLGEIQRPETSISSKLERVLRKALSSRPEDRYPSLEHFKNALACPPRSYKIPAMALALGLGTLALFLLFQSHTPPSIPPPTELPETRTFESGRIPVTGNDQAFMKITAVVRREGKLKVTYQIENESLLQGVTARSHLRILDAEGHELFAVLSDPWGVNGILIPGMENTRTEYKTWGFDPALYPRIHEIRFEAHEALHAAEDRTKALWRDLKRDLKKISE